MNYLAICAIVKDENDYLPEWLDYHFRLGVEKIYLYDDDSLIPVINTVQKYKFKNVFVMNSVKTTDNRVIESLFNFTQNFFIFSIKFVRKKLC